jgi:hypothetical protein
MANIIRVDIVGDESKLRRATGDAQRDLGKMGSAHSKAADLGKKAFLGISAAAIGFAGIAVKASIDDQRAQALLAKTLQNTTGARSKDISGVEKWITATQNASGVLDDDLRPALGTALRATGDVRKAQGLLKLAMDVSAATGKPLATVTAALAKGYKGQTGALGKLGVATKDASGKALTFDQIQKQLEKKMGGSSATAAKTLSGQIAIAKAKFEDIKETVGARLIPILTSLVGIITGLVGWLGQHKAVAIALGAAIATVTTGLIAFYVAQRVATAYTKLATVATTLWSVASKALAVSMYGIPLVAIIAGIALLVSGIVLAYTKVGWFRNLVDGAFRLIKS